MNIKKNSEGKIVITHTQEQVMDEMEANRMLLKLRDQKFIKLKEIADIDQNISELEAILEK